MAVSCPMQGENASFVGPRNVSYGQLGKMRREWALEKRFPTLFLAHFFS
jgi:hypothetical protein